MPVQYTNRKGEVYHLHTKQTKTGKTNYYFTRKKGNSPVKEIPEGFEIFEDPERGQVYLRKTRNTSITPAECQLVENSIRTLAGLEYFRVVVEGDTIVVYTADVDDTDRFLDELGPFARFNREATRGMLAKWASYTKMLRFTLLDPQTRTFKAERWCFKGSIDDWIGMDFGAPLERQIRKYVKHLGKESFFELF